ncbi:MAG TPA: GYD domain-containing protein [Candidatus Solibacter sp.]|jgi:uncharacterized protein with GYD domain|nr:GYD domain-containing protein [Candidatus Solibacter sp.]
MPTYVQLLKWTDQGRKNAATIADRVDEVVKRSEAEFGVKVIGAYVTMGQYDQVVISEAPNDEAIAKVAMLVAGRGNATTETVRAFTMDEVRALV